MFNSELISKLQKIQTPFYYYDLNLLESTLEHLKNESDKYNYNIHYALKANANDPILGMIRDFGFGIDCVSGNELTKAISLGFDASNIVFAGVGKNDKEIRTGLKNNIFCFNCESIEEIEVINMIAGKMKKNADIALRINPDLNSNTHEYLTTGLNENKFGIHEKSFDYILDKILILNNIRIIGLHFHIGSQITDLRVYENLCRKVNDIQTNLIEKGININHINLGGGLGINYKDPDNCLIPDFADLFNIVNRTLKLQSGQKVHFEFGRSIVGQCGNLITKVLYIKNGGIKKFAVVDAGMTELIRPALYKSYHKIDSLTSNGSDNKYDVVGPICESSDSFGSDITIPSLTRGDLLAIRSAGAYGQVMSSNYNLRKKVKAYYSYDFLNN